MAQFPYSITNLNLIKIIIIPSGIIVLIKKIKIYPNPKSKYANDKNYIRICLSRNNNRNNNLRRKNIIQINENKVQNNSLGTIRISLSINNIQGNNNILRTGNNMWEINNISRNDNINLNFFLK